MAETELSTEGTIEKKGSITLMGAIFIGIGSMVGAGIFALFGEAGKIAGAAVWVSFLIAGIIALLQGYSFAKLGARFPSSGGLIAWIVRGYGKGLFTGGLVVLGYFSVLIVTAMVAVSFGNYLTSLILGEGAPQFWPKIFAVLIVCLAHFCKFDWSRNSNQGTNGNCHHCAARLERFCNCHAGEFRSFHAGACRLSTSE